MHTLISINQLPSNNGLSNTLSPSTLITGEPTPDFNNIIKLNFGDYVLTPPGKTKNDQSPRRIGAIALYPSKNASGGWYFMSLVTGQILHRYSWEKLPIADDVINAVHAIADRQLQKPITNNFIYTTEKGINYDDPNELRSEDELRSDENEVLRSDNEPVAEIMAIDTETTERDYSEGTMENAEDEANTGPEDESNIATVGDTVAEGEEAPESNLKENEDEESGSISGGDQMEREGEENQERLSTPGNQHEGVDLENESNGVEVLEEVRENVNTPSHQSTEILTPSADLRNVDHREEEEDRIDNRESNRLRLRERINYRELHSKGKRTQMLQIHKKVAKKLKKKYKVSIIAIANIFYFKCKYLEHTSRGSKYTLAQYLGLYIIFV